ncbi:unnamed protein product [Clavelina lepadiformis]|uniref:Uncharacterized protein n=1 Tax=Clavelina lepadiformis TaxID=159417 RepID=A0ABP0GCW2_CLALP
MAEGKLSPCPNLGNVPSWVTFPTRFVCFPPIEMGENAGKKGILSTIGMGKNSRTLDHFNGRKVDEWGAFPNTHQSSISTTSIQRRAVRSTMEKQRGIKV